MSTPTLRDNMQAAFSSGSAEYSDMVIKDRIGTSYHVHRNILCWQSPFFANAMKEGRFKEGAEKAITLQEDEPEVVKAMLDYLYGGDYSAAQVEVKGAQAVLLFHINVYAIADEYCIADNGLANLACKYFNEATQANWNHVKDNFLCIISEVYAKTTDHARILRPTLIKIVKKQLKEIINLAEFNQAVDEVLGFGTALIDQLHNEIVETTERPQDDAAQQGLKLETFRCPYCARHIMLYVDKQPPMVAETYIRCPLCMAGYAHEIWLENTLKRDD